MRHILNNQQVEVLDHLRALVEEHKREISILYSELKLRLPSYLKSATVQQLREAGAIVDPDISFPKGAEEHIRKYVCLSEKVKEIEESFKAQVIEYYTNLKKQLPQEILNKELNELNDEEWAQLGICRNNGVLRVLP
jgi:hypothetical protein